MSEKGTCYICGKEYAKNGFTRHLQKCILEKSRYGQSRGFVKRDTFLIKVEDKYDPHYFMYILIDQAGTLKMLDDFLRGIWLECCGHLSSFFIDYSEFICDYDEHNEQYDEDFCYGMQYKLNEFLFKHCGFGYEYDYGSSTNLILSVKEVFKGVYLQDAVTVLARNHAPSGDKDNSPRAGVCGYEADHGFNPATLVIDDYPFKEFKEDDWDEDDWDDEDEWEEEDDGEPTEEEIMEFLKAKILDTAAKDMKKAINYYIDKETTSLKECLTVMTREDLKLFAKRWYITGISNLTKDNLITAIVERLCHFYSIGMEHMTDEKIRLIKKAVDNRGFVIVNRNDYHFNSRIGMLSIISTFGMFPVCFGEKDKVGLRLSNELLEIAQKQDFTHCEVMGRRNAEIVNLARGYSFYYGILPIGTLYGLLKDKLADQPDFKSFGTILEFNEPLNKVYYIRDSFVVFGRVFEPDKLWERIIERESRPEKLEYKAIQRKDLLAVKTDEHYLKSREFMVLKDFLLGNFEIKKAELDNLLEELMIRMDVVEEPKKLIEFFLSNFDFEDTQQANESLGLLMHVYNANRQWVLKGHCPKELFVPNTSFESNKPVPVNVMRVPIMDQKQSSNLTSVDFINKKKIGRNDPCSCGSGKKYKFCCGK